MFVELKRAGSRMAKGLLVDIFWNWEAKSFLWVTLCLKGVALLGVWAERATTTGASAGWEVNTMVWGSSKSGEGEGEARVIV